MKMYFIAVVLPPDLDAEIQKFKQWMHKGWGCKVGLKSPAHITLIPPFWMDENNEKNLVEDLDQLAGSLAPFDVVTNNFSCFKPRTIFIEPVLDNALQNLKTATDRYFTTRTQYSAKIDTRPFHPHITIATRDLRKSAFAAAWPYFQQQTFQHAFTASGIGLLRHNGQAWEIAHTSLFLG